MFVLHPVASGSAAGKAAGSEGRQKNDEGGDDEVDPRLYSIRIGRSTGIEWGTDISFSWVYIRSIHPDGSAASCGEISVGDQVCGVRVYVWRCVRLCAGSGCLSVSLTRVRHPHSIVQGTEVCDAISCRRFGVVFIICSFFVSHRMAYFVRARLLQSFTTTVNQTQQFVPRSTEA